MSTKSGRQARSVAFAQLDRSFPSIRSSFQAASAFHHTCLIAIPGSAMPVRLDSDHHRSAPTELCLLCCVDRRTQTTSAPGSTPWSVPYMPGQWLSHARRGQIDSVMAPTGPSRTDEAAPRSRPRGAINATKFRAWSRRRLLCLALIASGDGQTSTLDIETSQQAARWLTAIQQSDGSLPVSEGHHSPGWATPYALLLWSALPGYQEAESRARTSLLGRKGEVDRTEKKSEKVIGHDPSLVGWPWVDGTHSWLEPTALAILALCRAGLADHPRARAGVELILDRALESGGWNYGNKAVFGTELRPQPGSDGPRPAGPGRRRCSFGGGLARIDILARGRPRPPGARLARLGNSGPSGSRRISRPRPKPGWLKAAPDASASPTPPWDWRFCCWRRASRRWACWLRRLRSGPDDTRYAGRPRRLTWS